MNDTSNHSADEQTVEATGPNELDATAIPADVREIVVSDNINRQAELTTAEIEEQRRQQQIDEAGAQFRLAMQSEPFRAVLDAHIITLIRGALLHFGVLHPAPAPKQEIIAQLVDENSSEVNTHVSRTAGSDPLDPNSYVAYFKVDRTGDGGSFERFSLDAEMAAALNAMYVANDLVDDTTYHVQLGVKAG